MPRIKSSRAMRRKRFAPYKRAPVKAKKASRPARKSRRTVKKSERVPGGRGLVKYQDYGQLHSPQLMTKLAFHSYHRLVPADDGSLTYKAYSLSNLSDPTVSGVFTGHQPLFHDQWKLIYKRFRVISVDYSFTFRSDRNRDTIVNDDFGDYLYRAPGTSSSDPLIPIEMDDKGRAMVGLTWSDDATFKYASADAMTMKEANVYDKQLRIGYLDRTAGRTTHTFKGTIQLKTLFDDMSDFNNNDADFDANPPSGVYIHPFITGDNNVTFPVNPARVDLRLVYHVLLTDPIKIAGS